MLRICRFEATVGVAKKSFLEVLPPDKWGNRAPTFSTVIVMIEEGEFGQ